MHLTVYRRSSDFDTLRREWNPLLARTAFDNVFQTWEWQTTWWHHLGSGDLWLLAWRDGSGDLVGIAPLYLEVTGSGERRLSLVGCLEVSDYLDVIAAEGRERDVYAVLTDWLSSDQAPDWDVLDLCNLPEASPTHQLLPELAASRGFSATVVQEDVCPVIPLPATWDDYLAMLDKKQRHEVRRKMRRAEEAGQVSYAIVDQSHDLAAQMDDFIALHRLSQPDKDQFMEQRMEAFFRSAAQAMLDAGWLQLSFLMVSGEKAAAMLCFDYADSIMVYNSGYDPNRYSAFSPGIVLLSFCIRHAIENLGRSRFDFLQGDEVYKYRFGALETKVFRVLVTRPPSGGQHGHA
jgi:CelD/BcsL family acetyltransferase involved in cellulose biosynthesis